MIERLQNWVAAQAEHCPEVTALVLKYGRLEEVSNQLARTLIDGGCCATQPCHSATAQISADELEPDNFRSVAKIAGFVAAHKGLKKIA